jgi:hypothetical protein
MATQILSETLLHPFIMIMLAIPLLMSVTLRLWRAEPKKEWARRLQGPVFVALGLIVSLLIGIASNY